MKKSIFLLTTLLTAVFLFGCSDNQKDFTIIKETPTIAPYVDFDVETVLNLKEGLTYELSGIYTTSRGIEKEIVFNESVINIPENETVAEINVTWTYKKETKTELLSLSVIGTEDVIDDGMRNTWCEDSISKTMNYNPTYIKEGSSSVKVGFNGYYNQYGTQFISITGHLSNNDDKGCYDKAYYDIYKEKDIVEAYKDAVFYFWLYNATPNSTKYDNTDIRIGIRLRTHDDRINVDWNNEKVITCKQNEWTLVAIRLKSYGMTEDFYKDLDAFYASSVANFENTYDTFNFKVIGDSVAKNSDGMLDYTIKQNYTFYCDGFNTVTYEDFKQRFPECDLDSEKMGQTWEEATVGKFENWKNSGKGISFDFTVEEGVLGENVFALLDSTSGEWIRLSDYISLNLATVSANVGKLTKEKEKYHYELLFSDVLINIQDSGEITGTETLNMIYFRDYPNQMTISNFKVINNYSK